MREDIKQRIKVTYENKIPNGYQRTNAGLMPIDWLPVRAAGEIFANHTNKKHSGTATVLSATQDRGVVPRSEVDIDIKYDKENLIGYKKVDPGEFIISLRSFQGGIEYSTYEGLVSPAYTVLKNILPISDDYYRNYLKTADFISRLNSATYGIRDGKQIGYQDFKALTLHYPPLFEQQKIAEILNNCDKVIKLKQQLIEEEYNRKKWLMQNLLDPDSGVRLPGFSGKWKTAKMGELFEFGSSVSAPRAELGKVGICYLHYGDIHGNPSTTVNVSAEFDILPKILTANPKVGMLQHGDVVFVDASEDYEGASKYVVVINPENISFLPGLHTIPARSKVDVLDIDYKKYCFQAYAFKKQVAFYVSGMKVYGLNKYNLAKIRVLYPDKEEQEAIAKLFIAADSIITLLEQELTQWQQKKKALMQLLLTGIVRVLV